MTSKILIALLFTGLMLTGCLKSVKAYNDQPVRYKIESNGVAYAIKQAANKTRWRLKYISPGHATALKGNSKKFIKVDIRYSEDTYSINYLATSSHYKYNGSKIHGNYNKLVARFKKSIDNEIKIAYKWYPNETIVYENASPAIAPAIAVTTPVVVAPIASPFTFAKAKQEQPDSFALVIGISKYKQNTDVEFADTSALSFAKLANVTFGIPKENIITVLNEQASSGQLKAKIELIKELADGNGNLYIYYAGHGVPGKDGSSYILPYDMSADTIHLEPNLKLDNIYASLSELPVKKVFIFMDSCFSGKDDNGQLLYKGVAPVLKTTKARINSSKLTLFTAGKSTDFANDFEDKQQRMFSYYLINKLSTGETNLNSVYPDVKRKVKRSSLIKGLGYKQVPQIYGNKSQRLY